MTQRNSVDASAKTIQIFYFQSKLKSMKAKIYISAILFLINSNLIAQPGTLDSTFSRNGKVITSFEVDVD
jgi:hypothetical protein